MCSGSATLGAIGRLRHSYGDDRSQFCELFLPAGGGPFAVVVVVHGGYWRARWDRTLMTGLCEDLASHGLAAWNLEYRRVGNGGGWPETFLDVAAGIDALAEVDAPLDLTRVGAVGHSAGGHLALWAAARGRLPDDAPGAGPRIVPRAVVSQAGIADLRLAAVTSPSDEPTRALLGSADVYELASPRELVPLGAEQLVLHGECDAVVALEISRSYADAASAAGDRCELRVLPGVGHFEHIERLTREWRAAREWLAERLS
jgi:acetyl esterase/lipase